MFPQLHMLFQSTHEDRHGAEALSEPGEQFAKSPLQRTLTGLLVQARGVTREHQSESVYRDVGVAVRAEFSCEAS